MANIPALMAIPDGSSSTWNKNTFMVIGKSTSKKKAVNRFSTNAKPQTTSSPFKNWKKEI
jgi:hypothetical protein